MAKLCKISLALLCVVMGLAHAKHSGPHDYVNAHNIARAEVGVDPLVWDQRVAAYARQYAKQRKHDCKLEHSIGGPFGENLAWGSDRRLTGVDAVVMWVDEKADYDYKTNTCVEGKMCGHYTQVVWRNTTHLGCARTRCHNGETFIICSYYPPGNFLGERPF